MERLSIIRFAAASLLSLACANDACQAGLFGDSCLFRKNQTPPPVTTTSFYPNTAAATAPGGGCCGPAQCQQTVLKYVPQVSYRTVWQPVPVTQYRRTVSYNPATGLPITCTQPCTTYTYQARRVPYTTFRPTYAQVPVTPASYVAPTPPVTVTPAPSGCNNCTSTTIPNYSSAPAASPYYSTTPPNSTASPVPQSSSPTGPQATPWTPINPGSGTYTAPPTSLPPTGGDAADRQPTIPPEIQPDVSGQSFQRPIPPTTQASPSEIQLRGYNGAATSQRPSIWGPNQPSTTPNAATGPTIPTSPPSNQYNSQPLPNLDSSPSPLNSGSPQLNDPRDNTATTGRRVQARWASNQINWPERTEVQRPSVRRLDPSRIVGEEQTSTPLRPTALHRFNSDSSVSQPWSDDGWTSAAPSY